MQLRYKQYSSPHTVHIVGLESEFLELQDRFGLSQSVRFPYRHVFSFYYLILVKDLLEITLGLNDTLKVLTIQIIVCGVSHGSLLLPEL